MSEDNVTRVIEMISAAGLARTKYLEALRAAKSRDYDKTESLMREGEDCFGRAHEVHSEFLTQDSTDILDGEGGQVNLILVHAEDQMMCAETFRLLVQEMIDVYRKIEKG